MNTKLEYGKFLSQSSWDLKTSTKMNTHFKVVHYMYSSYLLSHCQVKLWLATQYLFGQIIDYQFGPMHILLMKNTISKILLQ